MVATGQDVSGLIKKTSVPLLYLQYIEGLKLLFFELLDASKGDAPPGVLRHYAATAGTVVQELVRKVQKVGNYPKISFCKACGRPALGMTVELLSLAQVFKIAGTEPLGPARPCKYGLNALMQVRIRT
jgi:hypothetical protein